MKEAEETPPPNDDSRASTGGSALVPPTLFFHDSWSATLLTVSDGRVAPLPASR
jgi:hypothetical protein